MASILTATVGAKGQVTLPKDVRKLLGIGQAGDFVGFLIDDDVGSVRITKLKIVPDEEFTEEEYRKLLDLPKKKGHKTFTSMKSMIDDLKSS